ncbi:hypothetical protein N0V90_006927 [Kalmusia sp. IMI 367209]|nr:hypothetical protein N0V90_006927 [Kalmusia sp. IMI 367209]
MPPEAMDTNKGSDVFTYDAFLLKVPSTKFKDRPKKGHSGANRNTSHFPYLPKAEWMQFGPHNLERSMLVGTLNEQLDITLFTKSCNAIAHATIEERQAPTPTIEYTKPLRGRARRKRPSSVDAQELPRKAVAKAKASPSNQESIDTAVTTEAPSTPNTTMPVLRTLTIATSALQDTKRIAEASSNAGHDESFQKKPNLDEGEFYQHMRDKYTNEEYQTLQSEIADCKFQLAQLQKSLYEWKMKADKATEEAQTAQARYDKCAAEKFAVAQKLQAEEEARKKAETERL